MIMNFKFYLYKVYYLVLIRMKRFANFSLIKYFTPSIFLFFFLIFNLGINIKTYGQAIYISSTRFPSQHPLGTTFNYCVGDAPDNLFGFNPGTKNFSGPGITDLTNGKAIFDPALAGAGTHTIFYNFQPWTFVVLNPVAPTLNPFPAYCSNDSWFTLSCGSPSDATSKYYVEGVPAITFDPTARGAGTYSITYSIGTGNCLKYSNIQTIVVKAIPTITFIQPVSPLCSNADLIDLTLFVSPAGGIFTGTGISGNTFDPSQVAAPGTYTIRYTYTDPVTTCTNYAERNIQVNAKPSINITGLNINQCDYTPDYNFTYSPITGAGGTGILTGNGISDLGGGNARFSPSTAGLGFHDMSYTYIDVNGCTSSEVKKLRVGTDIKITGLNINYCEKEAPVNFNYSHWDTDPLNPPVLPHTLTITAGGGSSLTDNGNGSETFDPSVIGAYIITYKYTDDLTCVNQIDKPVQVLPTPIANFSGLNAASQYCEGAADVTLSGNPPNGTFTGPAGNIVNIGGGIATFKPSALSAGGPYPITYSFTNSSGCTGTVTKNVTIVPVPTVYTVSGSGAYCQGSAGLTVTLFDSDNGINYQYQLYKNGVVDGVSVPGTGNPLTWPNKTAGTYSVIDTNTTNGCTSI